MGYVLISEIYADVASIEGTSFEIESIKRNMALVIDSGKKFIESMYSITDNVVLYGEGAILDFFKNLGTKIKAILKKIFEWLKKVVSGIWKFLKAPFVLLFGHGKTSTNNNGGGGAPTGNGDGAANNNGGTDNAGGADATQGAPVVGSANGIFSCFDGLFNFKYIKDTGYASFPSLQSAFKEILADAKNGNLVGQDSPFDAFLKDTVDSEVEARFLEIDREFVGNLRSRITLFKNTFLSMLKANRDTFETVYEGIAAKLESKDVSGDDEMLSTLFAKVKDMKNDTLGARPNSNGRNNIDNTLAKLSDDKKRSFGILSKYFNSPISYAVGAPTLTINEDRYSGIEHRFDLLSGLVGTTGLIVSPSGVKSCIGILYRTLSEFAHETGNTSLTQKLSTVSEQSRNNSNSGPLNDTEMPRLLKDLQTLVDIYNNESLLDIRGGRGNRNNNNMTKGGTDNFSRFTNGTFTIDRGDTYGSIQYSVKINTISIKELIDKGQTVYGQLVNMAGYGNLSKTLSDTAKVLDDDIGSIDRKINEIETTTAQVEAEPTPQQQNPNAQSTLSFAKSVAELTKKQLQLLKEEAISMIDQLLDVEKHTRLSYISKMYCFAFIELAALQREFAIENAFYRALVKVANDDNRENNKAKKANDDVSRERENATVRWQKERANEFNKMSALLGD